MSNNSSKNIVATNWQHFCASILIAVLFPLGPLFLEVFLGSPISESTMLMAAIMYCSAFSVASNSVLIFAAGFIASIFLSIFFGLTVWAAKHNLGDPVDGIWIGGGCMFFFAIVHCFQRYDTHVVKAQNFIDFGRAT